MTEETSSGSLAAKLRRHAGLIRLVSLALVIVGVLLLLGALPVKQGVDKMESWIRSLGLLGHVVFGAIYVVAVILVLPGLPFTIAAGAVFGLVEGTIVVSIASTTGAALTLLISRYLARDRVAKQMEAYPKFAAIDQAIAEGGWKIVALLRLSPLVPFNLQNYLYGLTRIRFLPCVGTSWVAMLPGTMLYVFVGSLTKAAAEEASGKKLAFLIIGLVATVVVTVYITKLAKRELAKQTDIADEPDDAKRELEIASPAPDRMGRLAAFACIALVVLTGGIAAQVKKQTVQDWIISKFGPPRVSLEDVYSGQKDGDTFDHSAYDELLRKHVDADGFVDYEGLKKDSARLETYIDALAEATYEKLGKNEKLALLINAYNAWTLKVVLDHYPEIAALENIRDIVSDAWEEERWKVAGKTWSLSGIEHNEIRPKFNEPRIHFALVCAAIGCPPLRPEAFVGSRVDEQLEEQSRFTHEHETWFRFDEKAGVVYLTQLYSWYGRTGGDFEQVAGSDLAFAARWSEPLRKALAEDREPAVEYLEYSWRLNDRKVAKTASPDGR